MAWGAVLTVASTALNMYGKYKEGQDASDAAEYNAELQRKQTKAIKLQQAMMNMQYDKASKRLVGSTVFNVASSNLEYTGTPIEVLSNSLAELEIDRNIENYNLEVQKSQSVDRVGQYETQASNYKSAAMTGSLTALMSGASKYNTAYGNSTTELAKA